MKNIIEQNSNQKFDPKIFNMSKIELEIVGLFEKHIINNERDLLWIELSELLNNDESIKSIINLYEKGAITMIECESIVLLFVRHNQNIWNQLNTDFKTTTKFRAPIELMNNVLNINYDDLKLNVSELKFIAKIMRLGNDVTYNKFFETDMTSFKNLLLIKTFFMKKSILESYSNSEFNAHINDLKLKTIKDLICHFVLKKIKKIN